MRASLQPFVTRQFDNKYLQKHGKEVYGVGDRMLWTRWSSNFKMLCRGAAWYGREAYLLGHLQVSSQDAKSLPMEIQKALSLCWGERVL